MMREIKFRGKSDDEWVYGFLFKSRPDRNNKGEY